jgi:hypothetical protein
MSLFSTASASNRGYFLFFFELGLIDECSSVVVVQPCPSVAVEKYTSSTSTQNTEALDSHHLVYMPSQLSSYQLKQQSITSNEGYFLVSTGHDTTFNQH